MHQIGTILSEVSPDAIAAAINELKSQPELLLQQKEACHLASEIENWENERRKLESFIHSAMTHSSL
jgi:hypothetical protein